MSKIFNYHILITQMLALIEVKGKTTVLKCGETKDALQCPDKDFKVQADADGVVITPLRNMKIKSQ